MLGLYGSLAKKGEEIIPNKQVLALQQTAVAGKQTSFASMSQVPTKNCKFPSALCPSLIHKISLEIHLRIPYFQIDVVYILDLMTETYLDFSRYALEACRSSNRSMSSDSRASSSDMEEILYSEVKTTVIAGEVKQLLDIRMKALEEEAEFSEQALLEGLEERKKLMDEIYVRLQFIRHSLSLENQETEQKSSQGPLIINLCKVMLQSLLYMPMLHSLDH